MLAKISVIAVGVWAATGWHAVLYTAYLQSIPQELYEVAKVDGASARQQFFSITLPLLTPAMVVSSFLLMTGGLKVFDLPYTLTNGGPESFATYTIPVHHPPPASARDADGTASARRDLPPGRGHLVLRAAVAHPSHREEVRVMNNRKLRRIGLSVGMILLAALVAVPLYYIVVNTFKTQGEMVNSPLGLPRDVTFDNYAQVLSDPRIYVSFANTLYVTALAVVLH